MFQTFIIHLMPKVFKITRSINSNVLWVFSLTLCDLSQGSLERWTHAPSRCWRAGCWNIPSQRSSRQERLVCRGRHWYALIWRARDGPVPWVPGSSHPTGEQRTQREVNSCIQYILTMIGDLLHINLSPNQPWRPLGFSSCFHPPILSFSSDKKKCT